MARTTGSSKKISIPQLRRWLLAALTIAVVAFTVAVFVLVQRIFDNFGPGVAADLQWKTLRGAQELSHAADLGLAVQDAEVVKKAFVDYEKNEDVVAIVAEATGGTVVASYGAAPPLEGGLYGGAAGAVRKVGDLLVAWAPAVIEGSPVGRVALVVTTKRLVDSRLLLRRLSVGTFGCGILTWICGVAFVFFFTRSIAARDAQLAEYASGLEKKVAERTAELARINYGMRLVLDNVEQGFITIDLQGIMSLERSTVCNRWFGAPEAGQSLITAVGQRDQEASEWLRIGLAEIREGLLPIELLISQLPARMSLGERTMRLTYQPIFKTGGGVQGRAESEEVERLLVVLTDITEELARERFERDSREMIRIFQRIASDRQGFVQFLEEVDGLMASVRRGPDSLEAERRAVHTIKGNASLYGVESMANLCHELETKLREEDRVMNDHERESVSHAWDHVRAISAPLLGDRRAAVELEEDDYRRLLAAIRAGASTEELVGIVVSWRREPVSVRFQRLADKAQYLAKRLGKPPIVVHQQGHGIRLDSLRWNPFWAASVHALNNALDHGIERPEDRRAAGKAEAGQIWLEAEETATGVTISIRDDGAGIDWEKVAAKAAAKGLPNQAHRDLVEALFAEGVSTRDEASLTSGRGTGMGALRDAVRELGGNIEVTSQKGQGTTFTFRFATEARPRIERAA